MITKIIPETDREREIAHQKYAEGYADAKKKGKKSSMFSIAGQSLGITVRVRLESDYYDLSTSRVVYPAGTCFNLLTDENGYVTGETLDQQDVIAIDDGQYTILWVGKGEGERA